jgi:hypothetical protein
MSVSIVFIQNQSNKIETICSIPGQPATSVCKQGVVFFFNIDYENDIFIIQFSEESRRLHH